MTPTVHQPAGEGRSFEERLERCEIIHFPACPFPLPEGDDHQFLLQQQLGGRSHKNISWNPHTGRVSGYRRQGPGQAARLRGIFAQFSQAVSTWVRQTLPHYLPGLRLDQVSYRPEEEAIRHLRVTARNDLLHIDSFPSRPAGGHRILRVFVNINPSETRVWVTSDPFGKLLGRYGEEVGLPTARGLGWSWQWQQQVVRLFHPGRERRSVYDAFMLRFHDFMKKNDHFQEHCPKRYWNFAPGSAWMAFTDSVSHAVLRGRFALEHSFFIAPEVMLLPEASPLHQLERLAGVPLLGKAA